MPQWAWEFLRRNPNYVQQWQQWQKSETPAQITPTLPGAARDFLQKLKREGRVRESADTLRLIEATREAKEWGLICPVDPAMAPTPGEPFWFWKKEHHRENVFVLNKSLAAHTLPKSPSEVIFVALDIRLPKGAQLKRVGQLYNEEQTRQGVSSRRSNTKGHSGKYLKYLRVLDAEALGVAPIEIRDELWPPQGAPNIYEFAEQARRLRDGGYLDLIPL